MEFRVLGPLEVSAGDVLVPVAGAKPRGLLAILLLHANEVVSTDRLIDALWGEQPPETALKALQVHISQLRKAIGASAIRTRPPGYVLDVGADELDLHRFQRLQEEARGLLATDPAKAQRLLRAALALWRGPPLADVSHDPFASAEIARLEELRIAAIGDRVEADFAVGRHAEAIGELEQLVGEYPLREGLHAQLMLALYRSGRQAEALDVYQDARRALTEELGIEPSRDLRELHRAILNQDPELDLRPVDPASEHGSGGVFVGRDRELAELGVALEDGLAGRGRLVLLTGEPGIGKSRLADQVIARARARGACVLVGRCWEAGGAPAYWPWAQSLRAYVRQTDAATLRAQLGAGAADLAQIVPEVRQHFPQLAEPLPLEPEAARFRLFDATTEFLRSASKSRPILLLIDDLHAADAPSLLLLRFLARELASTRMVVLGAYRNVDPIPGGALTELLAEVASEPVTRRLSLGGLSEREVGEYVQLTSAAVASREVVAALHEETEGNPLFVSEIVRLLSAEEAEPQAGTRDLLAIPDTVRDVIARRLLRLSPACSRMLLLASVSGREFTVDGLALASGASRDDLLDVLDEAIAARVLSDVPGGHGRLRFAHALIRDTLYDGLTSARRASLHRRTLEALEELYGDEPGPQLAELAHHALAGNDYDMGIVYARRAGDHALAVLAFEEAARLFETALDALDIAGGRDDEVRCGLLVSLGEAKARAGDMPAAKTAFLEASEIAQRLGLSRELAAAAVGYGGRTLYGRAGDDERLVPLLEAGLATLTDGDDELRSRLLARLAGALRDEPVRDRRDRLSSEAVELARRSEDRAALTWALDGRASAIMAPDTVAECLALGAELRDVAAQLGHTERVVDGHLQCLIAHLILGDVREAHADLDAMSRIADELGQPAQFWQVTAARAMLALTAGRLGEAEHLIDEAFAIGDRAEPMAIPVYGLQQYTICCFRGNAAEAKGVISDLVARYPARPVFRCALAHLDAQLGRTADAKRALDDLAPDAFSALPFDNEWLYCTSLLAETCALLGETDPAAVLYGLLVPWAALNVTDHPEGIRGSLSRYLGLLAATTGHYEEAAEHFGQAVAMNARMGARPWLAHTQSDYAHMLLDREGPGDRGRARELLSEALDTYRDLGMDSCAAGTALLAREIGTGP